MTMFINLLPQSQPAAATDSAFVSVVERALNNTLRSARPAEVYVVRVDGWFDYKWQQFSGTTMHEIAVWFKKLNLPPFHPARILSQEYYRVSPDGGYEQAPAKPLHIYQQSSDNFKRTVRSVSSSGVFVWYSRVEADSDRASLMVYTVDSGEASGWYAGFTRTSTWRLAQVKGISRREAEELVLAGEQASDMRLQPTP